MQKTVRKMGGNARYEQMEKRPQYFPQWSQSDRKTFYVAIQSGNSIGAPQDLHQVITEPGFDRPVNLAELAAEYHFIDFIDKLPGLDHPQIAAAATGRTFGMLGGTGGKIFSAFDASFQCEAFLLAGYHDMTNMSVWHRVSPW
jgi:hypothetical protein